MKVALLGPPGSGKSFYGKQLAQYLQLTVGSVSSILRNHRPKPPLSSENRNDTNDHNTNQQRLMDSGALLDCQHVCDILLDFFHQLSSHNNNKRTQKQSPIQDDSSLYTTQPPLGATTGMLLDGFPRTLMQIELMKRKWPTELQVQHAIYINVPDSVCQAKMLGRRMCSKCHRPFNIAPVHWDGFHMPAILPQENDAECHRHFGKACQPTLMKLSSNGTPLQHDNDDDDHASMLEKDRADQQQQQWGLQWWTCRKDDADPNIVAERLRLHREHEGPILSYYKQQGRLFSYTPKRGIPDILHVQQSLQQWFPQLTQQQQQQPSSST